MNKIDRDGSDPYRVIDEVFDLFDSLGGSDEQLDFSTVYASAINGVAGLELDAIGDDMTPLLDMIVDQSPRSCQRRVPDADQFVGLLYL